MVDYKVKAGNAISEATADRDPQASLYLAGRWLGHQPADQFTFLQVLRPSARRKTFTTSVVHTARTTGEHRATLARIALAAAQIDTYYQRSLGVSFVSGLSGLGPVGAAVPVVHKHPHTLAAVSRVSGAVLWANLHLLFWLSLVPFATAWMSEHRFPAIPTAVYGIALLASAVAFLILQTTLLRPEGETSRLSVAIGSDAKGKISPLLSDASSATKQETAATGPAAALRLERPRPPQAR